ncbi:MAG TPA: tRNA epoxyqueuosine(34) reductase QueG [Balneolales bacterium]|nr:tRNA epoxyqueuosine(34) reductase QueG [Balneolales bacterium]
MTHLEKVTEQVRLEATRLGFEACGFSKARRLEKEERRLEEWLLGNRNGTMDWMERNFDKRVDPTKLVPGAKSVVSVLCSYNQDFSDFYPDGNVVPKISKYALGDDYHNVLKEKLYALFHYTENLIGGLEGRVFVDSAPVLDKAWAAQSGIGWVGKNSNILNKELGSWFFIGELIVDAEFAYDHPTTDHCGTCTRCIDACPTDAIYEPYKVDGSKCISYLTIELRDQIPEEYHEQMGEWMFGCDICQDVCPWNRKAVNGKEERLFAREDLLNPDMDYWEELDIEEYRRLFKKNPVKRAKFKGLKRNISIVSKNLRIDGRE